MPMLTHELHPSLVHAPLGLLPTAAIVDLSAAFYPRAHPLHRLGRNLWWATAATRKRRALPRGPAALPRAPWLRATPRRRVTWKD